MATSCQHCGATTDNDARVMCPNCGRRMQPAQRPTDAAPPAQSQDGPPPASPYAPPQPPPQQQWGPPGSWPPPPPYAPPQPQSPYAPPPPPYGAPPPQYGAPPPQWPPPPPPPPPYGAPPPPPPYGAPPPQWPPPPPPYGAPPPYASGYPWGPALPPQVDVYFRREAIARTSRVTVLFRLVLALPHLVVLAGASLAAALLTVITWFAALFVARVPASLYEALGWVVGYGTRVTAYLFFLSDRWPTFTEKPDDPVVVRLPGPGRLNRAAVLFRLVLLVPVGFLAEFVNQGLGVVSIIGWVLILVMGRVPQPLFDATASAVRYQTRYFAYAAMLTARYPGGLFGDVGAPSEPPPVGVPQPPTPPAINRPAKRIVVTFIVIGVLAFIARSIVSASNSNDTQTAQHAQVAASLPVDPR